MRNYQSRLKVACACEDRRSLVKMKDHLKDHLMKDHLMEDRLCEDERLFNGRSLM